MNNQIPYFLNPQENVNNSFQNYPTTPNPELEKIFYKINRIEKNIRILENRVSKLETMNNNNLLKNDSTDMYII